MRRMISAVAFALLVATAPAGAFNQTSIKPPVTVISDADASSAAPDQAAAYAGDGATATEMSAQADVLVGATGDKVSYECRMRAGGVVCVFADSQGYRVCLDERTCMRTRDAATALAVYRPEIRPSR